MSFNIDSSSESEQEFDSDSEEEIDSEQEMETKINLFISHLERNTIDLEKFKDDFEYPFSFLNSGDYLLENILKIYPTGISEVGEVNIDEKNTFEKRIKHVFWYIKGENDTVSWEAIGVIKFKTTKYFFYYNAGCCYTGFDVAGGMDLYINKNLYNLLKFGVPQKTIESIS